MSLNMSEFEFIDKYGFSVHDLYYDCIDDIICKSYWCCTVSELAYNIAEKIHNEINIENSEDKGILYKIKEQEIWNMKILSYDIAIPYKDIFICFEIGWLGNSLSVKNWDIKPENKILENDNYANINELIYEEEKEYFDNVEEEEA